jgi:hypothetical protein
MVAMSNGCGAEETKCPTVGGHYMPLYTALQGNCGPIANPNRVPFDGGRRGNAIQIENLPNGQVTTEIVMKGCSLRMTQEFANQGVTLSRIDGDPIYIESENELSGTVSMMRFDPLNGQITCQGLYDARFTKNLTTIGGAAY